MNNVTALNEKLVKSLILLGDKEAGKTSMLQKYIKKKFEDNYIETLGKFLIK
jgi:GTPase SAR1 family protein